MDLGFKPHGIPEPMPQPLCVAACSAASALLPGNVLEMQILGPTTIRLNQKPWGWGSAVWVLTRPAGNSDHAKA